MTLQILTNITYNVDDLEYTKSYIKATFLDQICMELIIFDESLTKFLTSFQANFLTNFYDECFDKFLTIFLTVFLTIFLTNNLLTIVSFRIEVLSILLLLEFRLNSAQGSAPVFSPCGIAGGNPFGVEGCSHFVDPCILVKLAS